MDSTVSSPTCSPTFVGVGVDEREHPEPPGAEAPVVGERLTQVADADDDDRPVVGEPELARDPVDQELDLVPDATGAVGAEVREVLAHLAALTPASSARRSDETVSTSCSATSSRAR